jgi:phage-related protein
MPIIYARLALLEEQGHQLKRPYADFLRDKIYELRFKISNKQVRILYFFTHDKKIILTNAFIKKTDKVPENEIERAIHCRRDYFVKHGEKP